MMSSQQEILHDLVRFQPSKPLCKAIYNIPAHAQYSWTFAKIVRHFPDLKGHKPEEYSNGFCLFVKSHDETSLIFVCGNTSTVNLYYMGS